MLNCSGCQNVICKTNCDELSHKHFWLTTILKSNFERITEMLGTSCIVNIWLLQGKNLTNSRYFSVKMQDLINPNTSNAIPNCTIPNTTTVTIRDQKWSVLKRYLGFHCCLKPPVVTERIFTWPAKTNIKEYFHDLQRQISKNIYIACKDKCQNTHYFKI